jgi:hypothetical protein
VLLAFGPGLTIEAALVEPFVRLSGGKVRREKATLGSAS